MSELCSKRCPPFTARSAQDEPRITFKNASNPYVAVEALMQRIGTFDCYPIRFLGHVATPLAASQAFPYRLGKSYPARISNNKLAVLPSGPEIPFREDGNLKLAQLFWNEWRGRTRDLCRDSILWVELWAGKIVSDVAAGKQLSSADFLLPRVLLIPA